MKYANNRVKKSRSKLFYTIIIVVVIFVAATMGSLGTRMWYEQQLQPASSVERLEIVEIPEGATVQEIAKGLEEKRLIRSSQAFVWYVRTNALLNELKAGTYQLDAAQSTPAIIDTITQGKIIENTVTILPGKRLDQIKEALVKAGFGAEDVDTAFEPSQYKGHPALVAKPTSQSLEGYLFPETFNASSKTTAKDIVEKSLDEMAEVMTPELIDAWQKHGLGIHEAITLASIVEQEVRTADERAMVAGVFYNRLKIGMALQSDPTYKYAAHQLGVSPNPAIQSPYNTYYVSELPPGPIGSVSKSSLEAVANPKQHDYLYFVAGDDGVTRFSKTIEEHQELTKKYCIDLCSSY